MKKNYKFYIYFFSIILFILSFGSKIYISFYNIGDTIYLIFFLSLLIYITILYMVFKDSLLNKYLKLLLIVASTIEMGYIIETLLNM